MAEWSRACSAAGKAAASRVMSAASVASAATMVPVSSSCVHSVTITNARMIP
ncbi:hypothetical protein [Streptomyces sp. NPDC086777]|uniref:hypothetical protein n=1 Tax=Streptomyces sp. NPDC086777 TaxID=3154866 RepID=UPI00344C632D